jgi:uncharacterized protein (TIRG00374 family)
MNPLHNRGVDYNTGLPDAGLDRRRIAQGLRLFILLAVASSVAVIALTAGRRTLSGLAEVKWQWLLATAALWLVAALVDGVRLAVLSRAGESPLTLARSVSAIYIGYFMAAVTPFQVGGLPLQLYLMKGWGVNPGRASAMLLLRGALFYVMLFAVAPFVACSHEPGIGLLKALGAYVLLALTVLGLAVLATVAFPTRLAAWSRRLAHGPQTGRARRLLAWLLVHLKGLAAGLRMYVRPGGFKYLISAITLTAVFMAAVFGMSATLLCGLGVKTNALKTMGLNLLLCSVMLFVPTPGATGVAEAGAAGLFTLVCPQYLLGPYVLLWRLFSFYLGALVGGVLTLRHLSVRRD